MLFINKPNPEAKCNGDSLHISAPKTTVEKRWSPKHWAKRNNKRDRHMPFPIILWCPYNLFRELNLGPFEAELGSLGQIVSIKLCRITVRVSNKYCLYLTIAYTEFVDEIYLMTHGVTDSRGNLNSAKNIWRQENVMIFHRQLPRGLSVLYILYGYDKQKGLSLLQYRADFLAGNTSDRSKHIYEVSEF